MDHQLWLFTLLVIGIIALPGMDMAFVLASTMADGLRAGAAAVAGLVLGGIVHVAMSSAGIGLLLAQAPRAFNAVLLAGAGYLAWIALAMWRSPGGLLRVDQAPSRPAAQTFSRAFATCLLNPKAYVFMAAVFPQFIVPGERPLFAQVLALGAIIALVQACIYGAVALGAGRVRLWLTRGAAQALLARSVAALLWITAAATVWQGWRAATAA